MCRSELRSLKNVYPEFANSVDFYVVNIDPTEDIQSLEEFGKNQGYPWPVTQPDEGMIVRLDIIMQSTKVAIDADGVIVYREGFGRGDLQKWREVFSELSASG